MVCDGVWCALCEGVVWCKEEEEVYCLGRGMGVSGCVLGGREGGRE